MKTTKRPALEECIDAALIMHAHLDAADASVPPEVWGARISQGVTTAFADRLAPLADATFAEWAQTLGVLLGDLVLAEVHLLMRLAELTGSTPGEAARDLLDGARRKGTLR